MGELLTIDETAERLKVTPATVNKWIRARGLPVHGVTRNSRYCDWDEVRDWVTAGRRARPVVVAPKGTGKLVIDLNAHR